MQEIYKKIENTEEVKNLSIEQMKVDDYTENVLQEMKPSLKFSILPDSPYKTIIGIIEPELLKDAAERWKQKFQKSYSHQVIED